MKKNKTLTICHTGIFEVVASIRIVSPEPGAPQFVLILLQYASFLSASYWVINIFFIWFCLIECHQVLEWIEGKEIIFDLSYIYITHDNKSSISQWQQASPPYFEVLVFSHALELPPVDWIRILPSHRQHHCPSTTTITHSPYLFHRRTVGLWIR